MVPGISNGWISNIRQDSYFKIILQNLSIVMHLFTIAYFVWVIRENFVADAKDINRRRKSSSKDWSINQHRIIILNIMIMNHSRNITNGDY